MNESWLATMFLIKNTDNDADRKAHGRLRIILALQMMQVLKMLQKLKFR